MSTVSVDWRRAIPHNYVDVQTWLERYRGDAILVQELNTIIEEEGAHACKLILHILTQLEMDEAEAIHSWKEIISHHRELGTILKRNVSLRTAICDYFCSINQIYYPIYSTGMIKDND